MDNTLLVRAVLIIGAGAVLFWLITNYNAKQSTKTAEKFFERSQYGQFAPRGDVEFPFEGSVPTTAISKPSQVDPAEEDQSEQYRPVDFETKKVANDCFPKDRLTVDDLLPKDAANSKWAQVAPSGKGNLNDQNFLTAGFNIGVDTVQSSLRNANLQLRSEPPIPKGDGWGIHMSTIDPDLMRKPLDTSEW
jgi:hypothetical protein